LRFKQYFNVPIIKPAQTYISCQVRGFIISNFCCLQYKSRSHSKTGGKFFLNCAILDENFNLCGLALFKILFINKIDGPSVKTTFSRCIFTVQNVPFHASNIRSCRKGQCSNYTVKLSGNYIFSEIFIYTVKQM
jgi:hypothetical protein